jgi:sugar (pentulose or hexulose) kinase
VACGIYDSYESAVAAMCRVARRHEPEPGLAEVYARRYARYLKYAEALKTCV